MEKERHTTKGQRHPSTDCGKNTAISKQVPHFLRFVDANDHVEHFKQVSRAHEPIIEVTKVETFGLMLDDHADIWFDILTEDIVTILITLSWRKQSLSGISKKGARTDPYTRAQLLL